MGGGNSAILDKRTIIFTSGDILKDKVVEILEEYFSLNIDPLDELKEDAKIIDGESTVLAFIEIKGTKNGKRYL